MDRHLFQSPTIFYKTITHQPCRSNCTECYVHPQCFVLWQLFVRRISTLSSFQLILPLKSRRHLTSLLSMYTHLYHYNSIFSIKYVVCLKISRCNVYNCICSHLVKFQCLKMAISSYLVITLIALYRNILNISPGVFIWIVFNLIGRFHQDG